MPENPWGPDVAPHPIEEFDAATLERTFDWHVGREYIVFDAAAAAWTDDWWPLWYLKDAEAEGGGPAGTTYRMLFLGVG